VPRVREYLAAAVMMTAIVSSSCLAANAEPQNFDGTLTLQDAVARVQSSGFDVRAARGDAAMAAADAATVRASLRPQISISAIGLDGNEPQLGLPVSNQAYGQAALTLPLFTPSTRFSARAASTTARAAGTSVESTANDAVYAAVQEYRRAQLASAVFEARRIAVRDQQDHVRLTQIRVGDGKSPRYLLARDRAALAVAEQSQEDAAAEKDQTANDLAALLDYAVDSRLGIEPLTAESFDETREAVVSRALAQQPALLAAQHRVAAAESSLGAAHGAYLPSASLTAQSYNGTSSPSLGHGGGQIQVMATLPVVDGGSRAAAVERARGDLDKATALRDQVRVNVERDVADAYRELAAAERNLATAQAAQNDASEQLRIARVRESAGKGIELETLDALAVAAQVRETALRALARFDDAIAAVHHAAGDRSG